MQRNYRSSNLELLRVFAMLGIVIAHLIGWSPNVSDIFAEASGRVLYLSILSNAGKIGVHIFFMISGYFLCKKEFKFSRILRICRMVWFYSISILLIFLFINPGKILNTTKILQCLFPVTTDAYWFVTTYILILLISPALNIMIQKIDKKSWKYFFIFVLIFYSLNFISIFLNNNLTFDLIPSHRILTYIITYMVGACFRLKNCKIKFSKAFLVTIFALFMLVAWRFIMVYVLNIRGYNLWVINDQDIFVFISAIAIFSLFLSIKIPENNIINLFGKSTFAVYLLHENCFLRPIIWGVFNIYSVFDTNFLYFYPFLFGLLVLAAGLIIEIIRQKISKLILSKGKNYCNSPLHF